MMTKEAIIGALQSNGHRITIARKAIVQELLVSKKPFSALEMHDTLVQKGLETNKVTVYRELGFLEEQGILQSVQFQDGVKRYEPALDSGHKHHLICTECKNVQHVSMDHDDLEGIEQNIAKEKRFKIQSHSLEFYGLCSRCV